MVKWSAVSSSIALLTTLLVVVCLVLTNRPDVAFKTASSSFASEINHLGNVLQAGDSAKIEVSPTKADELMLLPCYCPHAQIEAVAPHLTPKIIDRLIHVAADEHSPAELVWLRDGEVLDICEIDIQTATDTTPRLWRVADGCVIQVRKELQSPNGFLSIVFSE